MIIIEPEAEGGSASDTLTDGVITVAAGEHDLGERTGTARSTPITTRVEERVKQDDVELGLVLHSALHPPKLVYKSLWGFGDDFGSDLEYCWDRQ